MDAEHAHTISKAPLPWFSEGVPMMGQSKVYDANDNLLFHCNSGIAQVIVHAVNKMEAT